jgi:hypothetical protein
MISSRRTKHENILHLNRLRTKPALVLLHRTSFDDKGELIVAKSMVSKAFKQVISSSP